MNIPFFQKIYVAVSEARAEDYQEFISSRKLVTNNHKMSLMWDLTNTNIKERLISEDIEIAVAKQGCWGFLLILDKKENCLYTLMNNKRYEEIILNPKKAPLYLKALVILNEKLGVVNTPLFDLEDDNNKLELLLNKLCNNFSSNNDFSKIQYNIITFSTENDSVTSFELNILDKELSQIKRIDITDFTTQPIMPNDINESNFAENPIPVLKLKKKAETRKGEKEKISIKENIFESKLQA